MSVLEIFDTIWYKKISPIAILCAAGVIKPNYKITWRCAVFELFMMFAVFSVFWTFYDEELAKGMIALTAVGPLIQVGNIRQQN